MLQHLKKYKGLLVLTVVFSAISSLAYVFIALLLQQILDIATKGEMGKFIHILLFSICYFLLLGLFMFCYSVFSKKLICKVMSLFRQKTFYRIVNRTISDYHKTNTAAYLSALTNDVKMIEESYLLPLLEIIQNGIVFTTSLIVMFYFDVVVAESVLGEIVERLNTFSDYEDCFFCRNDNSYFPNSDYGKRFEVWLYARPTYH